MRKSLKYGSFVALLALISCGKKDNPTSVDFGYNYLPLNVGEWIEYDVDSVVYDEFNATVDTFSFIQRDECVEVFEDLEGRTVYRFERSVQTSDTGSSRFVKSYSLLVYGVRAELLENNLKTVPLVFPPSQGQDWDANAFNAQDRQLYTFDYVDQRDTINDILLDSTLSVIQWNDTNNFIIKRFSEEHYARNVGLIYKRWFHIETQFGIDSGLQWIQTLRGFSVN